ncbi:hypothetical protein BDB01DRAFT_791291 [Pilobolus umbonatus]|nr:hypothetical protein BDB01DRAFT_791291 [Pilobolus umbonatus]
MDDDTIEYHFDDIYSFYAELDDILKRQCNDEEEAKRITSQYIRFLTRYQNGFIKTTKDIAEVAYKMIDSQLCLDFSTVVLQHILNNHALTSGNRTELLISYSLLLYAGKDEPRWMNYILLESIRVKKNRLFRKIIRELKDGFYDCYRTLSISLSLCFELCKIAKVSKEDLDLLDVDLFNHLLHLVEETRGDSDESFNYDVIRLIMVLNEQYMMSGSDVNLVLDVLNKRLGSSDTFSANLLFMLNRSNDTCIQFLILKLIYGIFTRRSLYEYFYTNDLYVLVDIILREMCDLGDTKELQTLRDAYLRVLEPLLENTQLRVRPYKKDEIHRTLQSLVNPGMGKKVNSTTKRIVSRIMDNWWDKICTMKVQGYTYSNSPSLSHISAYSSCSSNEPGTPSEEDVIDTTCKKSKKDIYYSNPITNNSF